jgi:hypothetical protein
MLRLPPVVALRACQSKRTKGAARRRPPPDDAPSSEPRRTDPVVSVARLGLKRALARPVHIGGPGDVVSRARPNRSYDAE